MCSYCCKIIERMALLDTIMIVKYKIFFHLHFFHFLLLLYAFLQWTAQGVWVRNDYWCKQNIFLLDNCHPWPSFSKTYFSGEKTALQNTGSIIMAIAFKNAENYFIALKCIEIKSSLPTLIMYSEIYSSALTEKKCW